MEVRRVRVRTQATAGAGWPERPAAGGLIEGQGREEDRSRLARLQAAFVSAQEAT